MAHLDGNDLFFSCIPPFQVQDGWFVRVLCQPAVVDEGLRELRHHILRRDAAHQVGSLTRLWAHFSRFRPLRGDIPAARHLAGDVAGSRTYSAAAVEPLPHPHNIPVDDDARDVTIGAGSLFEQLTTAIRIQYTHPDATLLWARHTVCIGVVRVFREWLSQRYEADSNANKNAVAQRADSGEEESVSAVVTPNDDSNILWVNTATGKCGFRFRVRSREWHRGGSPSSRSVDDENTPVTYSIVLEGRSQEHLYQTLYLLISSTEIVIQSIHLLLNLEHARNRVTEAANSTMIFGYTE